MSKNDNKESKMSKDQNVRMLEALTAANMQNDIPKVGGMMITQGSRKVGKVTDVRQTKADPMRFAVTLVSSDGETFYSTYDLRKVW